MEEIRKKISAVFLPIPETVPGLTPPPPYAQETHLPNLTKESDRLCTSNVPLFSESFSALYK